MIEVRVLGAGEGGILERVAPGGFDHPIDPVRASEFIAASMSRVARPPCRLSATCPPWSSP